MHLPMRLSFQGFCEPLANLRLIHSTSLFCISRSYILSHCICLEACSVTSHKRPSSSDFRPSLAAGHKAVYAGFAARPMGQISSTVSIAYSIPRMNDILIYSGIWRSFIPPSNITENVRPPRTSIFCYLISCLDPSARAITPQSGTITNNSTTLPKRSYQLTSWVFWIYEANL